MSSQNGGRRRLAVGKVFLEPSSGHLYASNGTQVFLRAQTQMVFRILIRNLNQLVSREDLIAEVWPDVAVTDDSLTQCVTEIRRALGDADRALLKTVPKRGFVLTAPEDVPSPAEAALAPTGSAVTVVRSDAGLRPQAFAGIAGTTVLDRTDEQVTLTHRSDDGTLAKIVQAAKDNLVAVGVATAERGPERARQLQALARAGETLVCADIRDVAGGCYALDFADFGEVRLGAEAATARVFVAEEAHPIPLGRASQDPLPALAVIPFQSLNSEAPVGADLGDLIAGDLRAALSRSDELNVISRLSSLPFKTANAPIDLLRSRLDVDFVVSGYFQSSGGRVSLRLELIECAGQTVLWSDRRSIDEGELLFGTDEIDALVSHLRRAIMLGEMRKVRAFPVESLRNYTVLWGAVGLMHRLSPSDFGRSKALLETLIARAAHQPAPYAWLARWYVLKVVQGWSDDPQKDSSRALESAQRALDLDPENALAHVNQGIVLTNLMRRLDEAEAAYDTALDCNPSEPHGWLLRGILHAFQDRAEEGVQGTERALRLAPLDPHRFFFLAMAAGAQLSAGNVPRALELTKQSLRLNRTHTSSQRMLVVAHYLSGDTVAAREALDRLLVLQPGLTVTDWLHSSPSAEFENGRRFAQALREAGLPE